jgi:hypothetical protein
VAITASVTNYSLINACADSTQWTGSTPANCTDFYKEGSQCVGFTMRSSGNNDSYIAGTWNLSGKHLHLWWMTTALKELNTDASGGMQIFMYDGTNTGYWKMSGSTTYPGGWLNIVLDCSIAPDTGTQPTMTAITRIGVRINLTGTSKNAQNNWVDHIYVGNGITIYGDDGGSDMDFADILAQDVNTTNGWGMIRQFAGVYYMVGSLTFGDASGTAGLKFADSLQTIVFENRRVSSSLYGVTVVNNGTGSASFALGTKSGSSGISGCSFRTELATQTPKYVVTCTDTDVGTFKLYGCNFLDASTVSLPATGTNREVLSSTFEKCGDVNVSTCKVEYCNFVSADDNGIVANSTSWAVKYCKFVACPDGIKITTAGSYTSTDNVFASCTKDLDNNTAGLVTFSNSGDVANASTYENTGGGTTSIVTGKAVNVHVEDENGDDVSGAVVYIQRDPATSYTSDTGNDAGDGTFVVNESVDVDQAQTGWLRVWKKSTNAVVTFRYASWATKTFTLLSEVTGSATAGSSGGTVLKDSAASFGGTEDVVVGDAIRNTTDGSWCMVDEVISTTELRTTPLAGGSDNTWTSGDNYSIHRLPMSFTDNDDLVDIPLYMARTDANGDVTEYTHNYQASPLAVTVRIRQNELTTKYQFYNTVGEIGSKGLTLNAVLQIDAVAT